MSDDEGWVIPDLTDREAEDFMNALGDAQPPTEPTAEPRCNCSLRLGYLKGHGPDPARCPVHGEPTAERAGDADDADDAATVLANSLQSDEETDFPRYAARRLARHLAAALAARPAAVPDRDENEVWPFGPEQAARLVAAVAWPNEREENRDAWAVRMLTDRRDLIDTEVPRARARLESAIRAVLAADTGATT